MTNNQYLEGALDLGTQAKFSFVDTPSPGYVGGDVLYELYVNFGVFITQDTNTVTVDLPTTGLTTTTRNYLRQITSSYASIYNITINLDGNNTTVLTPGSTCYVFWNGTEWMTFPPLQATSVQGRLEDPQIKVYKVIRGGRTPKYLDKVILNVDSGSGEVGVYKEGSTVTSTNIVVTGGTESIYTFSPKIEIAESTSIGLGFSKLISLEGVHYRIDLDDSP